MADHAAAHEELKVPNHETLHGFREALKMLQAQTAQLTWDSLRMSQIKSVQPLLTGTRVSKCK